MPRRRLTVKGFSFLTVNISDGSKQNKTPEIVLNRRIYHNFRGVFFFFERLPAATGGAYGNFCVKVRVYAFAEFERRRQSFFLYSEGGIPVCFLKK